MKNLVLIQARMGSARLPNKVMKEIAGKPDVQWVLERVLKSKKIDDVMLITSVDKDNLPLIHFVSGLGYRIYVGSEEDVLDRYYQAARLFHPEYVIRVTADCPLFDWRYLDMALEELKAETDYMWDATESLPDGLGFEIVKYSVLEESWRLACLASEREHVTQYVRKHPEKYRIQAFQCPIEGLSSKRWTLDENEDFQLIVAIYQHFKSIGKEEFVTEDILEFLKDNVELEKLNVMFARNEGLTKSLANDYEVNFR